MNDRAKNIDAIAKEKQLNAPDMATLQVVQEVLRGVVTAITAVQPDRAADFSATLAAFANAPKLELMSRQLLLDLAEGTGVLASAGQPKQ